MNPNVPNFITACKMLPVWAQLQASHRVYHFFDLVLVIDVDLGSIFISIHGLRLEVIVHLLVLCFILVGVTSYEDHPAHVFAVGIPC